MAGNNMKNILDKIEKLITEGQKELLAKFASVEGRLESLEVGQGKLEAELNRLDNKIDIVHDSLKSEIATTARVLDFSIKELGQKLDAHIKQPAHA